MKVVFAHDHIFYRDVNDLEKYYSKGSLHYSAWYRYLHFFEHINAIGRVKKINIDNYKGKFNLSNHEKVKITGVPSLSGPINMLKNRIQAENEIKNILFESDALIARLPSEIGFLAIKIAEEINIPWAVEVVACPWDSLWNYGNIQGKLYAPIFTMRTRKFVKKAKFALYVTSEFLQNRYPCSGKTIACSNVELPDFDETVLNDHLKLLSKEQGEFTIGLIGNIDNKIKGVDVALESIYSLKEAGFNFKLKILGSGNISRWEDKIDKYGIKENVCFCGTLSSGEPVFNWLDKLDLYIQPSYQEGLPRATIEAMGRGCPVIGSNAGGIPELIEDEFIHEKGDSDKLAELILFIFKNKNIRLKQSKRNFEEAKKYSKPIIHKKRDSFWGDFYKYAKEFKNEGLDEKNS